jgi:hypothetical protein
MTETATPEAPALPVVVPGGTPSTDALTLSPKFIRWLLVVIGAEMQRRHWIKDDTVNDILSYGMIVIPLIWSLIVGHLSLKTKQQLADLLPDNKARVANR